MQKFSTKYQQTEFKNLLKKSFTMIKWNLLQGCKYDSTFEKSSNVIYHINKRKNKNHKIISINAGKISYKLSISS